MPADETTDLLRIEDDSRVRVVTLDRPDALNSFNEALYDAATDALLAAADDPGIAVVVLTGTGRAFSSGADVGEMAARTQGAAVGGRHGFPGFVDQLTTFPKPLLAAVNGLAVGIGATLLGFVDLAFMASDARVRCPFTRLAVAPEAASSFTFPALMGRQHASWLLMSSEWVSAEECREAGLVWKVCEPDELMEVTMAHARILAAKPISSLVETKATLIAALAEPIAQARQRENAAFVRLLGAPANLEAFAAFAERREPDFTNVEGG